MYLLCCCWLITVMLELLPSESLQYKHGVIYVPILLCSFINASPLKRSTGHLTKDICSEHMYSMIYHCRVNLVLKSHILLSYTQPVLWIWNLKQFQVVQGKRYIFSSFVQTLHLHYNNLWTCHLKSYSMIWSQSNSKKGKNLFFLLSIYRLYLQKRYFCVLTDVFFLSKMRKYLLWVKLM